MRINAAGQQQATLRIDDAHAAGHNKVGAGAHILDLAVLHVDVSGDDAVMIDDLSLLDVQPFLGALQLPTNDNVCWLKY